MLGAEDQAEKAEEREREAGMDCCGSHLARSDKRVRVSVSCCMKG